MPREAICTIYIIKWVISYANWWTLYFMNVHRESTYKTFHFLFWKSGSLKVVVVGWSVSAVRASLKGPGFRGRCWSAPELIGACPAPLLQQQLKYRYPEGFASHSQLRLHPDLDGSGHSSFSFSCFFYWGRLCGAYHYEEDLYNKMEYNVLILSKVSTNRNRLLFYNLQLIIQFKQKSIWC